LAVMMAGKGAKGRGSRVVLRDVAGVETCEAKKG